MDSFNIAEMPDVLAPLRDYQTMLSIEDSNFQQIKAREQSNLSLMRLYNSELRVSSTKLKA